ncbi:MAG TPA: hypothetical protein VIQ05_16045 [Tardiphaga sp.]
MNCKIYIVNFLASKVSIGALHQYLADSVDILGYWNYIPAVYCVKSRLDATALRDKLRPFLPDLMMVAEIDPQNMNGFMPTSEIWSWFFEDAPEKKPTIPANLLQALMGSPGDPPQSLPPPPPPPPFNWPK